MPIFRYKAKNNKGKTKVGKVIALSEGDALKRLSKKLLNVSKIDDISNSLEIKINEKLSPVKNKDLVVFSRQFAVMISAHVTITEALYTIIEQTENDHFRNIISKIAYEVDGGALLSDALKQYNRIFSDFYCNIIKAGETSGKLDEVLNYLADEMEKDYDMLKKFKGAMIYPAFILAGLLGVGVVFIFFVLPELTTMLQETGAVLPLPTRIVIGITEFGQKYYLLLIALLIAFIIAFRAFLKTKLGKKTFDYFLLKVPSIGKLFQLIYLVRFCRSLSTLLRGGVSMNKSLVIVGDIIKNTAYKDIIEETIDNVSEGGSIISALEDSVYVPKMIPEMMSVGEKTGKLDDILEEVAKFYDKDVRNQLNNISAIIEPVIMVIMGLGVGIMVAAIILPMYNMASQF
ncbi:MAG: type II secretion system F family protein [Patescibacteria group bacterium]|nr:type II secretion system F family protein [Patescibacteria group bacterium]